MQIKTWWYSTYFDFFILFLIYRNTCLGHDLKVRPCSRLNLQKQCIYGNKIAQLLCHRHVKSSRTYLQTKTNGHSLHLSSCFWSRIATIRAAHYVFGRDRLVKRNRALRLQFVPHLEFGEFIGWRIEMLTIRITLTSSTCLNTLMRFPPANFPISSWVHLSDSNSSANKYGYFDTSSSPIGTLETES